MTRTTIYEVADAFLTMESMTHKKLQKLCYYAYSWHLALKGERLFPNGFEAWIHGPVDPHLYREYKEYGWQAIPAKQQTAVSVEVYRFLEEVYESYGHLSGDQLEYLTHTEEPWIVARGGLPEYVPCNTPIADDVIQRYYLQLFEEGQND